MRNIIQKIKQNIRDFCKDSKTNFVFPLLVTVIIGIAGWICNSKISKMDMVPELLPAISDTEAYARETESNISNLEENNEKKIKVDSVIDAYAAGKVNGESISIYPKTDELEYEPTVRLSMTNRNDFTTDIKNVIVEVVEYKAPDEFEIELPSGGADVRPIQQWKCDISNEKKEYQAVYMSDNKDSENYVCIEAGDTGEFNVVICPDTEGLYCIKVHVEYTFMGKIRTKTTDKIKFVFGCV